MGLTKPRAAQIFNLDYKQSTRVVTATNITLTGGAPNLVDGVTLSLGDRVLVTGQTTGSQNGLYQVTTLGSGANGTWARTSDGNENGEIEAGMIVMVTEGTIYADTQWKLITDDPIVINTTALTFTQNYMANSISGGTSNVVVNSNANVTVSSAGTANVLIISNTGAFVSGVVSATGNITGGNLLTAGLITATGNITGGNIRTAGVVSATGDMFGKELWSTQSSGDEGGQVNLGIPAANTALTGQVTIDVYQNQLRFFQGNSARGAYIDLTAAAVGVGSNLLAGGGGIPGGANTNVQFNDGGVFGGTAGLTFNKTTNAVATTGTFSATGNVAGGNILTGGLISATGNVTGGNLIAGTGASGNITGANVITANTVTATANITAGNLLTTGLISASSTITSAANVVGGNITTAGLITATGNVTGGNILTAGVMSSTGNGIHGNVLTGGLISATSTITSAANIIGGNLTTAGLITATGNVTGGNILTVGQVSATGNVTGNFFLGNGAFLTGLSAGTSNGISNGATSISIPVASGNITMGVTGQSNTVVINLGSFTMYGTFAGPKTLEANVSVANAVNAVLFGPVSLGNAYNILVPDASTLYVYSGT
jgi:hypothetical protein